MQKTCYPAVDLVLQRRGSISALQSRCSMHNYSIQHYDSLQPSSGLLVQGAASTPGPRVHDIMDAVAGSDNSSDHALVQESMAQKLSCLPQRQSGLATEIEHVRSWRQRRQDAARIIVAAARGWLQRRAQQQQARQDQLLWQKAQRMLLAWQQQAAQRQRVREKLAARQAVFRRAVSNAWDAEASGFNAMKVCLNEGPYSVAAAYQDWRLKGIVLLAWAQLVLGRGPADQGCCVEP